MMLVLLLQVFLLFISSSLSSPQPPPIKPPTHGGPDYEPPHFKTHTITTTELKKLLDNPTYMKMLWSMAKKRVNALPPPRNLEQLEMLLISIGQIVSQKLTLAKKMTEGNHPIDKGRDHHSEISIRMEHSHWSRSLQIPCPDWWNLTMLVPSSMP